LERDIEPINPSSPLILLIRIVYPSCPNFLMAAVSGPSTARHPSPFRKVQKISRHSAATKAHGPASVCHSSEVQPLFHTTFSRPPRSAPVEATHIVDMSTQPTVFSFRFTPLCLLRCPSKPRLPSTTSTPRLDHSITYALSIVPSQILSRIFCPCRASPNKSTGKT